MRQLNIAFIWHMHQPWYPWPATELAALPFVRLHACASYLGMPWLLREFDSTRVTFNLVPSLTEQISRYADGRMSDRTLELCRRDAADLGPADRRWLLTRFATGHSAAIVDSSARYSALSHKRGLGRNVTHIDEVADDFSVDELRDVQVWLNLSWCGYAVQAESEVVRGLIAKDRAFSDDDKHALLDEMHQAIGRVLPLYREMAEAGRAELTTSPYYHPILPLLCDMRDAQRRIDRELLPETLWREPEEARRQLERGRAHHERTFGAAPAGLWPSEGAVSDAAVTEAERVGFRWLASDQAVLAHSVLASASAVQTDGHYRLWGVGEGDTAMVFRDHELSDLIGFVYRDWRPADAAADMVRRLRSIARTLPAGGDPPLVCIALDGENPWGLYPDGGLDFVRRLYAAIEQAPDLRTVTVGEMMQQHPPSQRLQSVFPGSWIDYSYRTWIGGDQHRRAWTLLRGALSALQRREGDEVPEAALEHLMIAEGSDWFWWYSTDHYTPDADLFDGLFRAHVARVYEELGEEPPEAVHEPIAQTSEWRFDRAALGITRATIDGRVTDYFEWRAAALLRTSGLASAMHRTEFVIFEIYVGYEPEGIYLRVDTLGSALSGLRGHELTFGLQVDGEVRRLRVDVPEDGASAAGEAGGELASGAQVAVDGIVEARLALDTLGAEPGDTIGMAVELTSDGRTVERWPEAGYVDVRLPTEDELTSNWMV